MIKMYQKYLIKEFLKSVLLVTAVFFSIVSILNMLEELSYFKNLDVSILLPTLLNFLNSPSILYGIFPFIFLIATQFFFLNIIEKNELIVLKNFGIDNFRLIKILTYVSFIASLFIIIIFYNLSAKLKYTYLDIKNDYASDDKYLAVITENGLWMRDQINDEINIINAEKIDNNYLRNVTITNFDNNFNYISSIYSEEVNIENTDWFIKSAKISKNGEFNKIQNDIFFSTNFNSKKINSLFSNLESLTLWELYKLKKDYKEVGFSISEIDLHLQRIYSYPIYLVIMTILSSTMMLNIKHNKPKIFYLLLGIFCSVVIFYINHFANLLGENGRLPIELSIWLPHVLVLILVSIGLVKINEK
jgi:lipopolysaccharide export system permease protein